MGSWSYLTIGEIVFTWKYDVPSFLTFIFREEDLFVVREQIPPAEDEEPEDLDLEDLPIERAGYATTAGAARSVLDTYGYTLDFFTDIYGSFLPDLEQGVREVLADEL